MKEKIQCQECKDERSIIEKLKSEWPVDFALQPKTAQERKNVITIQQLKKDAAAEIERLREWNKRHSLPG